MRMRAVWLLSGLLLRASPVAAQDAREEFLAQQERAFELYERHEWKDAIAAFERQIACFPESALPYYNIACCHARAGDPARAATWLHLAIQHGWRDREHVDADPDFDGARHNTAFRRVREMLDAIPPVLPKRIPLDRVAPADSVVRILAEGFLAETRLDVDPRVWLPEQIRARQIGLLDHQMARLTRYAEEHGDARDGADAGIGRVRLAEAYLRLAPARSQLAGVSRSSIRLAVDEFVARWPTSPHLFEARLSRARLDEGTGSLLSLLHDAPHGEVAANAMAEILVRDASTRATLYPRFLRRYRETGYGRELLGGALWRVRLEQDGLPDGIEFDPPIEAPRRGKLVVAVVTAPHADLARAYAGDRLALVYLTVGAAWTGPPGSFARRPAHAAELLGVPSVPCFLTFEDGKLVAAKFDDRQD